MAKYGLGKGLGALLNIDEENYKNQLIEMDIDKIQRDPRQPRKEFSKEELDELAESIREKLLTMSEETILTEIGYVSFYKIKTHKAEIDTTNTIATSFDKQRRNTMYLIHTKEKVSDFSNYQRLHPSREKFFFNNPKIAELPKISECYLN